MKHWLSQIELGKWYSNAQYYYRPRNDKERNLMHNCYEEGYNKGYEEGKPKWHDLKKDPNDLPNNNREVLVLLWNYDDYYIGHYERYYDDVVRENIYWHFSDFGITENKLDSVLAWCELPKFKE